MTRERAVLLAQLLLDRYGPNVTTEQALELAKELRQKGEEQETRH